ncbi:hypothetical protein ACU8KH_05059 [Lachancea thermotolerans]
MSTTLFELECESESPDDISMRAVLSYDILPSMRIETYKHSNRADWFANVLREENVNMYTFTGRGGIAGFLYPRNKESRVLRKRSLSGGEHSILLEAPRVGPKLIIPGYIITDE